MNTATMNAAWRRWWRMCVVLGLLTVVGAVRGCSRQDRWIDGGSMAETLLGPHYELSCDDCAFRFRFGIEHAPSDFVPCPNCGRVNDVRRAANRPGERVLLDTAVRPQRGDIVAFRSPDGGQAVKRVVGLPGETVVIDHGDTWANGQRCQKSFAMFLESAIHVHDDSHRPGAKTPELPARWEPEDESESWRITPDGYAFEGKTQSELAWLGYRHWACYPTRQRRCERTPIQDLDSFNPTRSRTLFPVTDLMLSLDVWRDDSASFAVCYAVGKQVRTVLFSPRETVVRGVTRTRHVLPARRWVRLAVAIFDGRIVVAFDGRIELQANLEDAPDPDRTDDLSPWRIGASHGTVLARRIRIHRDLHYLDPFGQGKRWTITLGPREFCLLGDNVPLSRDSRHWARAGVTEADVLGVVR